MNIPRNEYPRPQFERTNWTNLNGIWEFEMDPGCSGKERKYYERASFSSEILVPFCPESELSGIGCKDFMPCVWYRKTITIPQNSNDGHILLHFGAIDYLATIYVNGRHAAVHTGGYSSFTVDITDFVTEGENTLVVCAEDDNRTGRQPRGKQSSKYYSNACDYTRTTGIWQTVWMEIVPDSYIERVRYYPDPENAAVRIEAWTKGCGPLSVSASYHGTSMGNASAESITGYVSLHLPLAETHLWETGCGRLYDLELTFGEDHVRSYFGLRSLKLEGMKFLINGKSVFQRLVLDQGFYPDGIYTAPNEEALVKDIELSLNAGFNGARLHEKVFESRFLYHCDRLGYIVWGEQGNWGLDHSDPSALSYFLPEWMEVVERDFNHPAIIGWCPFNETWDVNDRKQVDSTLAIVYDVTKSMDPTRPCIDTSGNYHVKTDIFDLHDYEQDPEVFRKKFDLLMTEGTLSDNHARRQAYNGEPCFISEYGGIKWDMEENIESWGYGDTPKTVEEFYDRYEKLAEAQLDNDKFFGFCYTQLYDVEQEKNGLYTYDRKEKFDMERIRKANQKKAAIEDLF